MEPSPPAFIIMDLLGILYEPISASTEIFTTVDVRGPEGQTLHQAANPGIYVIYVTKAKNIYKSIIIFLTRTCG